MQTLPKGGMRSTRVWKRFRADRRRRRLADQLSSIPAAIRQRRDPLSRWNWALRDITFEIEPGESVGLVGPNGSGKSTLLKILTRVMYPFAGRVEVAGRVGALIEVRAGLHPDLTGRENAFLYGSLLGLSRRQVAKQLDNIVSFAELDTAIDRQIKFYSSGMQMRLGFSVAVFLEPDVLLVDEVLAVGDASFQQRCLDRMREILQQGTTLVLVSHDLHSIEATCTRGIWLSDGVLEKDGPIRDVLASYRSAIEEVAEGVPRARGALGLVKSSVAGPDGGGARTQEPLDLSLVIESHTTMKARLYLGISEGPATPIFSVTKELLMIEGENEIRCRIKSLPLPRGRFYLWFGVTGRQGMRSDLVSWHPVQHFDVFGPDLDPTPTAVVRLSPVYVEAEWRS